MNANIPVPSHQNPRQHHRGMKLFISVFIVLLVGFIGYSIFVALYEPDPQETIVLGQSQLSSGSPAALRVLVRNRLNGDPIRGAKVRLALAGKSTLPLGEFETDALGTIAETIDLPEIQAGEYQLQIDATSRVGRDRITRKVQVQRPARVLLSPDKPIYQPGQTIHLRSLVLNGRTGTPFTNEMVTFEVSDPKGNKVFKETRRTSAFGIASADFVLATELNLGRYELRAIAGDGKAERNIEVKRYVLPKFKVHIATDKSYYLPGETVSGTITAGYFFGQPVRGAAVNLKVATLQESPVPIRQLDGSTDSAGKYSFRFDLPDFFVGLPQNAEHAVLDFDARIQDTSGHTEEKALSVSVAKNDLEITVIPEAGNLVPQVENILYVLAAYPDGTPALCQVSVDGNVFKGDTNGVSEVKVTPEKPDQQFEILVQEQTGKRQRVTFQGDTNRTATFLLRTDKAVYNAGETVRVTALSEEGRNTLFLDLIKDGQTVLTKAIPLNGQKAEYAFSLPASLVGVLKLNAYIITREGEDRGCSRKIYVNPASGLKIDTQLSQETFRPGDLAKLQISVTDSMGRAAPTALGVAAVDESVFALHENRPGLLRELLGVQMDMLKPRYQLKFFDSPGRLLDTKNQSVSAAYLASLEEPRSGLSLDDLVESGALPRSVIENVMRMRHTLAFEKYRSSPQYADAIRLLDSAGGVYSLREATGPAKEYSAEARRKAYFSTAKRYSSIACLGLLFVLPVALVIYYSRPRYAVSGTSSDAGMEAFIPVAGSLHHVLAALTLLPLVCYPAGLIGAEKLGVKSDNVGWLLLGFETVVVLLSLFSLALRFSAAPHSVGNEEIRGLHPFIWGFLAQFAMSRGSIAAITSSSLSGDGAVTIWFIGSLIAPLLLIGVLGSHIRSECLTRGVKAPSGTITFFRCLVVLATLFVLAGLMLPALAKAKAKAQSIKLLNDLKNIDLARLIAEEEGSDTSGGTSASPRVRRDFPETLFWQPEVITDDTGKATIEIPLADSITTWRTSIEAVNGAGRMGSIETPITVFQDFFVDLDLPVSMSLGDQVTVPATCYNYLKEPQEVRLTLAAADWFESPTKHLTLHLQPNEVKSVQLPLKVLRVGTHALRVTAQGNKMSDAIEREVRVLPTGQQIACTKNESLQESFEDTFVLPGHAIADSQSLWLKFYPSRFSEVVEGLESIFQAPYGCFEQTSSTTYPNVLVLDYMKRTGRISPEVEMKARKYINAGYQRLLTFEVSGGGFEWFGRTPANVCLTAYGILEFTDMARVHAVDPAVIDRARKWLFAQQSPDGTWQERNRGWTWSGRGSMTAFVAWALAESGDRSSNLDRALDYLRTHPNELVNMYAKALAANAFLAQNRNDAFGLELAAAIKNAAISDRKGMIRWKSDGYSVTYSNGSGMDMECTALCATALIKAGKWPQSVKQALTWISSSKFANGTLGSTQATILAMRALLAGSETSVGQDFDSTVTVQLNGRDVETVQVTKENSDVVKLLDLTKWLRPGENKIVLKQTPSGELPFQWTGVYWLPSSSRSTDKPESAEELKIVVEYDRTKLSVNDLLGCSVKVKNNSGRLVNMAIIDLGIPPGFDVDTAAFETMAASGQIAKFEVTGNQVVLYLRELPAVKPFDFTYSLRAKYPLRVQAPVGAVYEYYQPENRAESSRAILQVAAE